MKCNVFLTSFLASLSLVSLSVQAAGGHHAVDDAALLDVGKCKVEGSAERQTGGGPLALPPWQRLPGWRGRTGHCLDNEKQGARGVATSFDPQIKWAYPLNEVLSIGVAASAKFNSQSPRYASSTVVIPLT